MREALVFGASGQIGAALCARLLAAKWQVLAVSRQRRHDAPGLRWLQGGFDQPVVWPAEVDSIFSCGPLDRFSHWYDGSSVACPRVVAFGSTSVGVKQDSGEASERDVARRLREAEQRIMAAALQRGAHATVLRPTLVYGAGRDLTLSRIAALARRARCFVLPRGAMGLRQPVHVEDLALAAQAVVDCPATHGRSYALPGGETLPYRDMVTRVLASLQPPARLVELPQPLFSLLLRAARLGGRLQGANAGVLARMHEDLVFDLEPAQRDFGYAPRRFKIGAGTFG